MGKYEYFVLGIILGIGILLYIWASMKEKIEAKIEQDKKVFSTKKLDVTLQTIVERINKKIIELKRELTEDEKNKIIMECYKEKFNEQ